MATAAAAAACHAGLVACCSASRQDQVGVQCNGLRASPVLRTSIFLRTNSRARLQICCAVAEPETLKTVQKIIAGQLSVNEADVKPDSKFADLGADSLDTVEIMMNLEESFKISLGEEGAEKIATVQDAADMIQEMLTSSKA